MTHKIMILQAPFYPDITAMLLDGAQTVLAETHNSDSEIISVPGALEIPAALARFLPHNDIDGFITLGCVIRGQTDHYDLVCRESLRRIGDLTDRYHLALGMGILTVNDRSQACARADPSQGDIGGRAAKACLALIALTQESS